MKINTLYEKYPWLNISNSVEEYVTPKYYNKLLKDYIFSNKLDLELFEDYLKTNSKKNNLNILELGCGTGRATEIILDYFSKDNFDLKLVDLSQKMLNFCRNKFENYNNLEYIKSDIINFLENDEGV